MALGLEPELSVVVERVLSHRGYYQIAKEFAPTIQRLSAHYVEDSERRYNPYWTGDAASGRRWLPASHPRRRDERTSANITYLMVAAKHHRWPRTMARIPKEILGKHTQSC